MEWHSVSFNRHSLSRLKCHGCLGRTRSQPPLAGQPHIGYERHVSVGQGLGGAHTCRSDADLKAVQTAQIGIGTRDHVENVESPNSVVRRHSGEAQLFLCSGWRATYRNDPHGEASFADAAGTAQLKKWRITTMQKGTPQRMRLSACYLPLPMADGG